MGTLCSASVLTDHIVYALTRLFGQVGAAIPFQVQVTAHANIPSTSLAETPESAGMLRYLAQVCLQILLHFLQFIMCRAFKSEVAVDQRYRKLVLAICLAKFKTIS